jgi:hypothetical protein
MAGLGRREIGNSTAERVENSQTHVKSKKMAVKKAAWGAAHPGPSAQATAAKRLKKSQRARGWRYLSAHGKPQGAPLQ